MAGRRGAESCRGTNGLQRLESITAILHVDDFAVPQAKDLEQLGGVATLPPAPLQADNETGVGLRDDLCSGIHDLALGDALRAVLEDRPGLLRAVSARRAAPPEVSGRHASPLEAGVKQLDKRFDISTNGSVEGGLDAVSVTRHRSFSPLRLTCSCSVGRDLLRPESHWHEEGPPLPGAGQSREGGLPAATTRLGPSETRPP